MATDTIVPRDKHFLPFFVQPVWIIKGRCFLNLLIDRLCGENADPCGRSAHSCGENAHPCGENAHLRVPYAYLCAGNVHPCGKNAHLRVPCASLGGRCATPCAPSATSCGGNASACGCRAKPNYTCMNPQQWGTLSMLVCLTLAVGEYCALGRPINNFQAYRNQTIARIVIKPVNRLWKN